MFFFIFRYKQYELERSNITMNSEKKGQRKFIEIYLIKAFKKKKRNI